jgi:fibronectin-binding autotransporter adhesin
MRTWSPRLAFLSATLVLGGSSASMAQNVGAVTSGYWNDGSTWTTGTPPGSSNNVYIGNTSPSAPIATVTLTQAQSANNVYLGTGSGTNGTLDLAGNSLTITGSLVIGQSSGIGNLNEAGGSFTATNAVVENGNSLSFGVNDAVSTLNLGVGVPTGATVTTAATGNVTSNVNVATGSTLNLGANMNLAGSLNIQDGGSILNMGGYDLSANTILLANNGSSPVTLENRGTITAGTIDLANGQVFAFNAGDTTANLNLGVGVPTGATVTTAATGNVTSNVNVATGSTLNLGANMNLAGSLNIQDGGSSLNAQGHALTANDFFAGWNGTSSVSVTDLGQMTLTNLYVGNSTAGSDLTLHGGDVINSLIDLRNGSVLAVEQTGGIGLTLNGTSLSSLTIDPSSMDLVFSLNTSSNWDFRWADPNGGNWIGTIDSMIASGQIVISSPDGYSVVDSGGFTYIMGGISSVPEPSSRVLACLATVSVALAAGWKNGRKGR